MAQKCTVCAHADVVRINEKLISGVPLQTLAKENGLTASALHRHKKHIPAQLAKTQEAKETAEADSLMQKVTALNGKAEDIYSRALEAKNLNAAIAAVRELRGITELYAKITGELQSSPINNIIVMPEWVSLRTIIMYALEPYPEARKAVIEAIRGIET